MNESTDHVIPNKVQNTYIIVQKLQEAREIAKIGKTKTVTKAVSPVTPVTEKAPNSKPRKTTLEKFSHLGKFDLGLTQFLQTKSIAWIQEIIQLLPLNKKLQLGKVEEVRYFRFLLNYEI